MSEWPFSHTPKVKDWNDGEMVIRVADAICSALASWADEPLHLMAYRDAARSAIEAMREPTAAMIEGASWVGTAFPDISVFRKNWIAMIDAALEETTR